MLIATGSLRGKQSDADFISCGNRIAETWSRDYHLVIERGRKHRSTCVSLRANYSLRRKQPRMTEHHVPWCASISSRNKSYKFSMDLPLLPQLFFKHVLTSFYVAMPYRRGATTTYFDHGWMGEIEPRGGRRQKLARPNKWSHSTGLEFIIARGYRRREIFVVVPRLWPWNFSDDSNTRDIVNLSKVKFLATNFCWKSVDSGLLYFVGIHKWFS